MTEQLAELLFAPLRLPVESQGLLQLYIVAAQLPGRLQEIRPQSQADVQKNNLHQGK